MYAVGSDLLPVDEVKLLIERGANVNAKNVHPKSGDTGLTPLDIAKLHGETPLVQLLIKSGARGTEAKAPVLKARQQNTIQSAIQSSLPLIQRADAAFVPKAACFSCHNNSMAAIAIGSARGSGFKVDEKAAAETVKANVFGLVKLRDYLHQGFFTPVEDTFGPFVVSYVPLLGLGAEHYPPDLNTDAVAMYLKSHQTPDGAWPYAPADSRPPICSDRAGQTAIAMQQSTSQLLMRRRRTRRLDEQAVQLAAGWLAKVRPDD